MRTKFEIEGLNTESLTVGDFDFWRDPEGKLWVQNGDQKKMPCNPESESHLETMLEQWWEVTF